MSMRNLMRILRHIARKSKKGTGREPGPLVSLAGDRRLGLHWALCAAGQFFSRMDGFIAADRLEVEEQQQINDRHSRRDERVCFQSLSGTIDVRHENKTLFIAELGQRG